MRPSADLEGGRRRPEGGRRGVGELRVDVDGERLVANVGAVETGALVGNGVGPGVGLGVGLGVGAGEGAPVVGATVGSLVVGVVSMASRPVLMAEMSG